MTLSLIWFRGLPASGKDYQAKVMITEAPGKYKRINKDLLRDMLDNSVYSGKNEKFIIKARNLLIEEALSNGYSVLETDTNFNPIHEQYYKQLANQYKALHQCIDQSNVSLQECIKRDLLRPRSVGEAVIRKMWAQYLAPKINLTVQAPDKNPAVILVDLDGTLAHATNRSYYGETTKYLDDRPNEVLIRLLNSLSNNTPEPIYIILVSGREEKGRYYTEQWLEVNELPYLKLFMRANGDSRSDWIVKDEIFNKYIKDNYRVLLAIDDRLNVIDKCWSAQDPPIFTLSANQYRVDF